MFPQTLIILYVKIAKQLKTSFEHSSGGGKGHTGLGEGVKHGVLVGVGVGVGDSQGFECVPDGVGVGVREETGVEVADGVGVGVGMFIHEQSDLAKPS